MNRIDNELPQVPPPTYHQNPFADPANFVQQDARPIDQFEVINRNAQQAARSNRLRTRGMRDVTIATSLSVLSSGVVCLGANLLGKGNLIGLFGTGAAAFAEGVAILRVRNNPATTPSVAFRQGAFSVAGTVLGATAGLVVGLNSSDSGVPRLLWGIFTADVATAVLMEGMSFLVGRRGVNENTANLVDDNAIILG